MEVDITKLRSTKTVYGLVLMIERYRKSFKKCPPRCTIDADIFDKIVESIKKQNLVRKGVTPKPSYKGTRLVRFEH